MTKRHDILKGLGLLLGLTVALAARADFDLSWYTVDGGGDMWTSGGSYELSGTIGQPDATTVTMTGGHFELVGGFWAVAAVGPLLHPGDLNCDGTVDFDDIPQFVRALQYLPDGQGWPYPNCPWWNADCNLDGDVDFDDIPAFIRLIGT